MEIPKLRKLSLIMYTLDSMSIYYIMMKWRLYKMPLICNKINKIIIN